MMLQKENENIIDERRGETIIDLTELEDDKEEEEEEEEEECQLVDEAQARMEGVEFSAMHGNLMENRSGRTSRSLRSKEQEVILQPPLLVSRSDKPAREGYDRSMLGHEYMDDADTLREKVHVLAELLRSSRACCLYTGAGISTGAGIADYASRDNGTSVTHTLTEKAGKSSHRARLPGMSHRVLVALQREDMVHEWIQQNHDGLPQKAGLPQHCINEIHGAWFDPSNPVVTMSGDLREDLVTRFDMWKKKADLVLALGTSLAAVAADNIVGAAAKKQQDLKGKGAVIISLQRTYFDDVCALRIFGRLDEVLDLLAVHMELQVDTPQECAAKTRDAAVVDPAYQVQEDVFLVPYDLSSSEKKAADDSRRVEWDLREGAAAEIKYGPAAGFRGVMLGKDRQGHYEVEFPRIVGHKDEWLLRRDQRRHPDQDPRGRRIYTLGSWWVQAAVQGLVDRLPFVSVSSAV